MVAIHGCVSERGFTGRVLAPGVGASLEQCLHGGFPAVSCGEHQGGRAGGIGLLTGPDWCSAGCCDVPAWVVASEPVAVANVEVVEVEAAGVRAVLIMLKFFRVTNMEWTALSNPSED